MQRGFSILEIAIAIAVLVTVLSGVVFAHWSASYWIAASQSSREALYKAQRQLEVVRSDARADFIAATSSSGVSCTSGLCYFSTVEVDDVSPCSKYASSSIAWEIPYYPTTTMALVTMLTSSAEALALGGDCSISHSLNWDAPQLATTTTLAGDPTGIDSLHGVAYVVEDTSPYLEAVDIGGTYRYQSPDESPLFGIDVVRDTSTGSVYAYIAASSTLFQVLDVTDASHISLLATRTLAGTSGNFTQGRSITYYDHRIYVTTNQKNAGAKLHIFDVSDPTNPTELGSTLTSVLNTTVYGIAIRDQLVGGSLRRFAYLSTTLAAGELQILDVTNPTAITLIQKCDLPGAFQAISTALIGEVFYLGRDSVPASSATFYAYESHLPTSATFCTTALQGSVAVDSSTRSVQAIRVSKPYIFVITNNTSPAQGRLQVRRSSSPFTLVATYPSSTKNGDPAYMDMDYDGDANTLSVISSKTGGIYSLLQFIGH